MSVECARDDARLIRLRTALTRWYAANARILPWRHQPGDRARPDPYRVWLSEVMLQQTTVAAVTPYFQRFVDQWPTVADLAAAPEADVLAAWAGLGYYSRARNLIACARAVVAVHGGRFPDSEAALLTLPGVGAYTAAAVAAFAFGERAVPLDANVARVLARLFALPTPLPAGRAAMLAAAQPLWPETDGGDFGQAMMDLGSAICTARRPRCLLCPLAEDCAARASGEPERFPARTVKAARPERHGRAWWWERDGAVWLVRRPARGLLGGMRALPGGAWGDAVPPLAGAEPLGAVRHVFTHFALTLALDRVDTLPDGQDAGEWWPIDRLDDAGLPTLYRRAATLALAGAG